MAFGGHQKFLKFKKILIIAKARLLRDARGGRFGLKGQVSKMFIWGVVWGGHLGGSLGGGQRGGQAIRIWTDFPGLRWISPDNSGYPRDLPDPTGTSRDSPEIAGWDRIWPDGAG